MARIMFWSAASDGCEYYRLKLPAQELAKRGHQTHVSQVWHDSFAGKGEGWLEPDVLVGQRITKPGPSSLWQAVCKDPDIFTVFEMDDDLFHVDPTSEKAYEYFSVPEVRSRLIDNISAADRVVTSTTYLAEVLEQWNPEVRVVPNTVPASITEWPISPYVHDFGWAGSGTHNMDWADAEAQVKRYLKRNPNVSMHMIGVNYGGRWGIEKYEYTGWRPTQEKLWRSFDFAVGLAPLRPHVFNRSKSHIKALEYAAVGIPVIASAVEPYRDFVDHGETGFLVRREHEWGSFMHQLTLDPLLREQMAFKAREKARLYTTERWGGDWANAYGVSTQATLGV